MQFKIKNVQSKNADWKTCSVEGIDGSRGDDVSVNRVNKKGETFPNFDGIINGATIEANLWASPAGKQYLFAPKAQGATPTRSAGAITKAMEKKAENIAVAQENRAEGVKVSSTARDAVLCAIAEYQKKTNDLTSLEELIEKWRKYLWLNFEKTDKDYPPFN